ncbi:hypothetical protein HPB52_002086 [Rhipicephalus sanguineus]|uniref:Mutator-like transposase domain-containing protein n=1 Tax=Rhipicephalus sanguineus TaxID=34632 RepID=A0A9D4Q4Y1_RHISA|nr:hypothetical protein HPB52_002086 [Rhipicephalus sanguineus]
MPGSAKKYRTVHAFGRRKRKGRGRKAAKSSEPLVDSEERCVDAPRPFSSGATERVASDSDDGRTSAAADSGRLRVDAKVLTEAEVEENRAREKETLERLSSAPATARKIDSFTASCSEASTLDSDHAAPYLKQKSEGKRGLGGKGRLTGELITRLSTYYGRALKSHEGDVGEMQKAVMATYRHVTSTDECSDHSLCPAGESSWCRHNAAKAKGQPDPKHAYNLPKEVAEALLPVYTRLSEKALLERCQRGKTQNSNESLHSVIWSLAAKEHHASLFAVEAAVAEAVLRFNTGNLHSATAILDEMDMNATGTGSRRAREKDHRRSISSTKKRTASLELQKLVKRRHERRTHSDYASGAF